MLDDSAEKYKHYNPAWSFASAATLGAAREITSNIGDSGYFGYLAFGLRAAISATDLYLYSQSAVPLGISLLAATIAEKYECPPIATTALRFGCSALVKYALDPGATWTDIAVNTALSVGGAAIGSAFVKGAVELTKNIATVCEDLRSITPNPDEENRKLHTSIHPYEHFILTDKTPRERS